MKKSIFTCLLFMCCNFISAEVDVIHKATKKVIDGDKTAIKVIYQHSLKTQNEELKPYLIRATALYMLSTDTKKLSSYLKSVSKTSPSAISFINYPPLKTECSQCTAHGKVLIQCKNCQAGKCKNCGGKGKISYGNGKSRVNRDCSSCKKTGNCQVCQGTDKVSIKCRSCNASGATFNKAAIKTEASRALKVLFNKAASLLATDEIEVDKELLSKDQEYLQQGQDWLATLDKKKAEWEELDKKRIDDYLQSKKKKEQKAVVGNTVTYVETYEEGGSTANLDHLCKEVSDFIKAKGRQAKQSVIENVYGKYLSDLATVHIVVTDNFLASGQDYKQRTAEGFYQFTLLRAERNGYAQIGLILLDTTGNEIGGIKGGNFWLQN